MSAHLSFGNKREFIHGRMEVPMDARKLLPTQLITLQNFNDHAAAIEAALGMKANSLLNLFSFANFDAYLNFELNEIFNSKINAYFLTIDNTAYSEDESPIISDFIENQRLALRNSLEKIYNLMQDNKQKLIDEHIQYMKDLFTQLQAELNKLILTTDPQEFEIQLLETKRKAISLMNSAEQHEDTCVTQYESNAEVKALFTALDQQIKLAHDAMEDFIKNNTTNAAETTPAVTTPTATPSFIKRHPLLSRALIGMAIGISLVAAAAITLGVMVLTGGAAAAPIIAFAGLLAANLGTIGASVVTAVAGLAVIGAGTAIGVATGTNAAKQTSNTTASSTKKIMKHVRFDSSVLTESPVVNRPTANTNVANPLKLAANNKTIDQADTYSPGLVRRK